MAERSRFLLVPVCLACVLAACVTPVPIPEPRAPAEPIVLGPEGSYPVVFESVLYRIPVGTVLGSTYLGNQVAKELRWTARLGRTDEHNVAASDQLRRLGYDARDYSDSLFNPSVVKTRYQIAGVVNRLQMNFYMRRETRGYVVSSGEGIGAAEMDIEFQIYDAVNKEVVFKRTYMGFGRDEGREPSPAALAVVDGLKWALADPEFVSHLAKGDQRKPPGPNVEALTIARCESSVHRFPADMNDALDAIVTVVAGGTTGSGVIISEEGYVLTAAHVVSGHDELLVRLHSGLQIPAGVERIDGARDVALLTLPGRGYACLSTRPTDDLDPGTEIFVVGSPFGFQEQLARSVSKGIVSGHREIDGRSYLQTDAVVNPGMSGGPALDESGHVLGIVVEKILGTGIEGLGFAVPWQSIEKELAIEWE